MGFNFFFFRLSPQKEAFVLQAGRGKSRVPASTGSKITIALFCYVLTTKAERVPVIVPLFLFQVPGETGLPSAGRPAPVRAGEGCQRAAPDTQIGPYPLSPVLPLSLHSVHSLSFQRPTMRWLSLLCRFREKPYIDSSVCVCVCVCVCNVCRICAPMITSGRDSCLFLYSHSCPGAVGDVLMASDVCCSCPETRY